jgi:hypothetical protein
MVVARLMATTQVRAAAAARAVILATAAQALITVPVLATAARVVVAVAEPVIDRRRVLIRVSAQVVVGVFISTGKALAAQEAPTTTAVVVALAATLATLLGLALRAAAAASLGAAAAAALRINRAAMAFKGVCVLFGLEQQDHGLQLTQAVLNG